MSAIISQQEIMQLLDKLYIDVVKGVPRLSPPVDKLAEDYLSKTPDIDTAARKFINYQVAKCTTSGVIAGFGGLITLPVTIPANIGSVLYVQMRMIAGIAYMAGYDTDSDQVQTLIYACLAGISVDQLLKSVGVQFGTKFTMAMIRKIPGTVLTKINQKVGFRLVTKFGTKGLINLGKAVPIVGSVIGGGLDFAETKVIADRAYKMFIKGEFITPSSCDENVVVLE